MTTTVLSRSIMVLDLVRFEQDRSQLTFEVGGDEDGYKPNSDTSISIPAEKWKDMGRPTQITVTVEPGDDLNG